MSFTQFLHRGNAMYPDRTALSFAGRSTSYGDLLRQVKACAAVLYGIDPEPGARVGILSANCDRAIVSFHSCVWAGMVPNYLNVRWSAHELGASIDDFAPTILVVDEVFLEMGLTLRDRCDSVQHILSIGEARELPAGVADLFGLADAAQPMDDHSGSGGDMLFLNYTGGTTGKGKGVIHSHDSHAAAMALCIAEGFFARGATLMATPLFHISGIGVTNSALMQGNTLHIMPAFDPVAVMALIESERIVQALLVPTMLQMILHHPDFGRYDLGSLKYLRYGASPIDESLLLELKAALPHTDFMQIYGQTEGVPATLLHDSDHSPAGVEAGRTRSAGTPCFAVELEIRDEQGRSLPRGEIGEIALRGPQLMQGYLNLPEQTAAALKDGWLITGDAGFYTEDGYLHVVDRIKDMIVSGGENVYSAEVESAVCGHAAVEQCAVVGLPDPKWGERVHAEVVLKPGAAVSQEELVDHCREFLAGYKLPRSFAFSEAIPLTAVGKVDKVAIRACHEKPA